MSEKMHGARISNLEQSADKFMNLRLCPAGSGESEEEKCPLGGLTPVSRAVGFYTHRHTLKPPYHPLPTRRGLHAAHFATNQFENFSFETSQSVRANRSTSWFHLQASWLKSVDTGALGYLGDRDTSICNLLILPSTLLSPLVVFVLFLNSTLYQTH